MDDSIQHKRPMSRHPPRSPLQNNNAAPISSSSLASYHADPPPFTASIDSYTQPNDSLTSQTEPRPSTSQGESSSSRYAKKSASIRSSLRVSEPPTLLARFAPPQDGLLKFELALFPVGFSPSPSASASTSHPFTTTATDRRPHASSTPTPSNHTAPLTSVPRRLRSDTTLRSQYSTNQAPSHSVVQQSVEYSPLVDQLVISCVLLSAEKDEWKRVRSKSLPSTTVHNLSNEEAPPYTPSPIPLPIGVSSPCGSQHHHRNETSLRNYVEAMDGALMRSRVRTSRSRSTSRAGSASSRRTGEDGQPSSGYISHPGRRTVPRSNRSSRSASVVSNTTDSPMRRPPLTRSNTGASGYRPNHFTPVATPRRIASASASTSVSDVSPGRRGQTEHLRRRRDVTPPPPYARFPVQMAVIY